MLSYLFCHFCNDRKKNNISIDNIIYFRYLVKNKNFYENNGRTKRKDGWKVI